MGQGPHLWKEGVSELLQNLEPSFEILMKEGGTYLEEAEYEEMMDQFSKISSYIDQIDFSQPLNEELYILLHFSESTMNAISKIGIAKYNEEAYEASLSIFSLLSSWDLGNEQHCYRLGIVALQMEQLDVALKAFAYAIYLDNDFLGARIFSAQCYLKQGEIDDAKAELTEIKNIIDLTQEPESIWFELISCIEEGIKK